jgi:hypothetical protein
MKTNPNNPPPPDVCPSRRSSRHEPPGPDPRASSPPPPDESQPESQDSTTLLSETNPAPGADEFTKITRSRHTTSPAKSIPEVVETSPIPTGNKYDPLTQDDVSSLGSGTTLVKAMVDMTTRILDNALSAFHNSPTDTPIFSDELAKLKSELEETHHTTNSICGSLRADMLIKFGEHEEALEVVRTLNRQDISDTQNDFQLLLKDAITKTNKNIKYLTETNETITKRMLDHQTQIEHLMSYKEQRRQQMDHHWQKLEALESSLITVQTNTALQSQQLTAQLDGIHSNNEQAHTTARNGILDIRARLLPELRTTTNTLSTKIDELYSKTPTSNPGNDIQVDLSDFATPPIHASANSIHNASVAPATTSRVPLAPLRPTCRSDQSWYAPTQHKNATQIPTRPPPVDTSSHVEPDGSTKAGPFLGGRITTPRSADKDCIACLKNISRHNIAGLACVCYHGGKKGVQELSLSYIHECGYQSFSLATTDDVLPCYGSIQLLHKKVKQSWYNPRTLQSGPSVERILERGLSVIPKLEDLTAKDTVTFYERLQQVSATYLIPMMPFDSICLANNYEGLFPPGLGTDAYAECSMAVLELLPRLLPATDPELHATISAVRNSSRNGYDLLWRVLALYVPGFDP